MIEFVVESVNLSPGKGTAKRPVPVAVLLADGFEGDGHRGADPSRAVSLLDMESMEAFSRETGLDLCPGAFGENLSTRGLDLALLREGTRLEAGDVVLEVAALGKKCHGDSCAIFRRVGRCIMPARGVFCRVVRGGTLRGGCRGLCSLDG